MSTVPTRDRIRDSAADLFQHQGYHATGVKQIVGGAGAPLASLYHFFPGGKEALGAEVVRVSGAGYQALVESVWDAAPDVVAGVHAIFDGAAAVLEATGYEDACPIATVALEVASTNETLRIATAEVFDAWIVSATGRLAAAGIDDVTRTRPRVRDRRRTRGCVRARACDPLRRGAGRRGARPRPMRWRGRYPPDGTGVERWRKTRTSVIRSSATANTTASSVCSRSLADGGGLGELDAGAVRGAERAMDLELVVAEHREGVDEERDVRVRGP